MSEGHFEAQAEVAEALDEAWRALHQVAQHAASKRVRAAARNALNQLDEITTEDKPK